MEHEIIKGEQYWAKFGTKIDPSWNNSQLLESCELGFEINKENAYRLQNGRFVPSSKYFLVNSRTKQEIDVCGEKYEPLQNEKLLNSLQEAIAGSDITVERAGYRHGAGDAGKSASRMRVGQRCAFFLLNLGEENSVKLFGQEEELHTGRILFYNHHAVGCGMGVRIVLVRAACSNGMVSSKELLGTKLAHTAAGIAGFKPERVLEKYAKELNLYSQKCRVLAEKLLTDEEVLDILLALYGEKNINKKGFHSLPLAVRNIFQIYKGEWDNILSDRGISLSISSAMQGTAYGLHQANLAYQSHFRSFQSLDSAVGSRLFGKSAAESVSLFDSLSRLYVPMSALGRTKQSVSVTAGF